MYKMDNVEIKSSLNEAIKNEHQNHLDEKESAENFQKFIFELFEKNGILNDLRAYLRRHIVNVLKSAHAGNTPACQKHFAQRLELTTQAINMLIAEYLLRFEFGYSLSVFLSEIPLGNMVFDFADSLVKGDGENQHLRFKDKDVWSILNYLEVKLDSDHVSDVIEMYKREEHSPLLVCILKCLPMYQVNVNAPDIEQGSTSEATISTTRSSDTLSEKPTRGHDKCRHYTTCKSCHSRVSKLRNRYKKKKRAFVKKQASVNSMNVQSLLNNISAVESSLVDEVFEQLKTVYEAEVDMVRLEEEKKVKRSLADHALQLIHHKQEMDEAFKAREQELERNVRQKKKFLWGLARSLRLQHEQMSRAMLAVRGHSRTLTDKEDTLRTQLLEAEQSLKQRGEDMRAQISSELVLLETHLVDMKRERDALNREREELERMKELQSQSNLKIQDINDNEEPYSNYDQLRKELAILRKYIESTRSDNKCLVERGTVTDVHGVTSKLSMDVLNNGQNVRASKEDVRLKSNQLVNDFKKQKNVNFCVGNMEDGYCERQESSCTGFADTTAVTQLRRENEQLRQLARMQQQQLEQLSRSPARLPLARPRTAPSLFVNDDFRVNNTGSSNSFGWRKGAGEELTLFANCPTRVALPGEPVPFIGVLRDRHADTRRHLINQWRALRRASPAARRAAPAHRRHIAGPSIASPQLEDSESEPAPTRTNVMTFDHNALEQPAAAEEGRRREKSPKSVLREAKQKLRTKSTPKHSESIREKSPSSVLREAKLRLRKLEIEAEAVEQSYRDFRNRQAGKTSHTAPDEAVVTRDTGDLNIRRSSSHNNVTNYNPFDTNKLINNDFDKYFREYHQKFDLGEKQFTNRNTVAAKVKPIPDVFSPQYQDNATKLGNFNLNNLLETPLTEFRKYYRPQTTQPKPNNNIVQDNTYIKQQNLEPRIMSPLKDIQIVEHETIQRNEVNNVKDYEAKKDALVKAKDCKKVELEILKQNINKMYNIPDTVAVINSPRTEETKEESSQDLTQIIRTEDNIIRIEVENEISAINVVENVSQDLSVVVQSNVETAQIPHSDSESDTRKEISGNMTILISPKKSISETSRTKSPEKYRSISPEQAARLTRNDVFEAIFHADTTKINSSLEILVETSKDQMEDLGSEIEKDAPDNYTDDFSADVDNYNSISEHNSPISLPKSPDDNFWDN